MTIKLIWVLVVSLMAACSGQSSDSKGAKSDVSIADIENPFSYAMFRDLDSNDGMIGGKIELEMVDLTAPDNEQANVWMPDSVSLFWIDSAGNRVGDAWLQSNSLELASIDIPAHSIMPQDAKAMLLVPQNRSGESGGGIKIEFHDFTGNALLSGPGGNEIDAWSYGVDRPKIAVKRTEAPNATCVFDNGLVSVSDMNNTVDQTWDALRRDSLPNYADENAFPAYRFACDESPVNTHREVSDENGVWTYSTINDAMFYGSLAYDMFLKYLREPPLEDKVRLRVHYGGVSNQSAYWDGAYANFGDGFPFYYSMVSLDAVAHEIGHGVLDRISKLKAFSGELSIDAKTLHEAFADISGLMAKYEYTGNTDNWVHGEQFYGFSRRLDQIETEPGAIASFLDYDNAGENFYLRIGMITYPFYWLTNQWGIESAYDVYLRSARQCWVAQTTLPEAAQCIKQQAGAAGLSQDDVAEAFKTVKIRLFEEGVLSHFETAATALRVEFSDDSQSTTQPVSWRWDFGDGEVSSQENPEHSYAQAGTYKVRLTVTDLSNDQDYFERWISVEN
jgi:hypothetical protein